MKLGLIFIVSIISKFYLTQEKNNYVMLSLTTGVYGYATECYIGKDKLRVESRLDLVKDESYMSNARYLKSENFPRNNYISEGVYTTNDNKIPYKVYTDVILFDKENTINDFTNVQKREHNSLFKEFCGDNTTLEEFYNSILQKQGRKDGYDLKMLCDDLNFYSCCIQLSE